MVSCLSLSFTLENPMQVRIPLTPLAFPFLCLARIIGFALGAVVSLSLVGLAVAATTGGFGWQREVVDSRKIAKDLYRTKIQSRVGWYVRLIGGSTKVREYLLSTSRYNNELLTSDGRKVTDENLCRMVELYHREHNIT